MACPISIGDAQQIVHYAVVVYRKIHDADGEIRQVGIMMEELDDYLGWLFRLVSSKSTVEQLDQYWKELMDRITQRMGQIKRVSQGIYSILKIYHDNGSLSKYLFPFGRNPKSLRALMEDLQRHENALYRELWSANLISDQTVPGGAAPKPSAAPPAPTPSPRPVKGDCGIIFVDPHNLGRSKVAEAYVKLLREWAVTKSGKFPVKYAHSAGMNVKNRSDCTEVLEKLKPPISMSAGNWTPAEVALDSLFDNKYMNIPGKDTVRTEMAKSRSRGVNKNIFHNYDYILVFVQREWTHLIVLKALLAAYGMQPAPKGKGRIIHLGSYISKDGNPVSIPDAKKDEHGEHSRTEWNETTSKIKLAIKGFLKEELDWVQPTKTGHTS